MVYEDTDEADLDEKEMEHARKLYLDGVLDDDDGGDGESDHSSSGDEYDPCEWIIPLISFMYSLRCSSLIVLK